MIGAPVGTKISHGTPKCRAANANAWAWLPALPAVTPAAAAEPSEATLFIAPRILKAPVRCRLSAFSTTSPPARSESAAEVTTGVCLAATETTPLAARMSSSVTAVAASMTGMPPVSPPRTLRSCAR